MEKERGYKNGRAIWATLFYVDKQRNRVMVVRGGVKTNRRWSASVPYVLSMRASFDEEKTKKMHGGEEWIQKWAGNRGNTFLRRQTKKQGDGWRGGGGGVKTNIRRGPPHSHHHPSQEKKTTGAVLFNIIKRLQKIKVYIISVLHKLGL
jgi:hypothetical protein